MGDSTLIQLRVPFGKATLIRLRIPVAKPTTQTERLPKAGWLIYVPRGKAKEYAPLALNLYCGCGHGCQYCYAPQVLRVDREKFHTAPCVRAAADLAKLEREAAKLIPSDPILMSFTTDCYQALDVKEQLTRRAIQILHKYNHPVQVLTKGGSRALRDLDLFTPKDAFGTTLTWLDSKRSREWEPEAALPADRIETIRKFHAAGIPTWVSLEPVLDPDSALEIIRRTQPFVDLYKIGKWNYDPRANEIDWGKFTADVVELLNQLGKRYLLKDSLRQYLPHQRRRKAS